MSAADTPVKNGTPTAAGTPAATPTKGGGAWDATEKVKNRKIHVCTYRQH